jgi:hypothetical protein
MQCIALNSNLINTSIVIALNEEMTEQQISTQQSYCEVYEIDVVDSNTNLKILGKLFCSNAHLDEYVKAR